MAEKMKSGNGPRFNTTTAIPSGDTEGLGQTLTCYESEHGFDMNMVNDPVGSHPEMDGSGIGKSLKGSGSKP